MTSDEALTETIRVRLTPSDLAELAKAAADDDRNVSSFARRAIRRELDQLRKPKPRKR